MNQDSSSGAVRSNRYWELGNITMSRRLNRLWLLLPLLLASQSWALGLGDIRLSSALNEPLRAEIELLAATPEDLDNLTIQLASAETFERYDLDRPVFLSRVRMRIVKSGSVDGNVVSITSPDPITEPFITFLVEAVCHAAVCCVNIPCCSIRQRLHRHRQRNRRKR